MFLLLPFLSRPVTVVESNFSSVIANEKNLPVFIKCWSMFCPFCKAMYEDWRIFSLMPEFSARVIIAEIECTTNRHLCHALNATTYPRILWYDPIERDYSLYLGERKSDRFAQFTRKQLSLPFEEINSSADIPGLYPSFVLYGDPSLKEYSVAASASRRLRSTESHFYFVPSEKVMLTAHIGDRISVDFSDEFSEGSVFEFLRVNSIPFLASLDQRVKPLAQQLELELLVLIGAVPYSESLKEFMPVVRANCSEKPSFCQYHGVSLTSGSASVLLMNLSRNVFFVLNNATDIDSAKAWIRLAKSGILKPRGPGNGAFKHLLEMVYLSRSDRRELLVPLISVPLIFVACIVFFVSDLGISVP